MGPSLPFSEQLHAEKYRGKGESFKEAMNRIAGTLEDSDPHFRAFREILLDMRFMPGGRVQTAIGSTKTVTAYNCFVSGTIADSFVEGTQSIMGIATEAAATMRMGGGIGYNFGTLRPRGDYIRKLASKSSGPISFMEIYDAICRCISSSGHRRGAQMAVMPVDHPDIEEFIHSKQPPKEAYPVMDILAKYEPGTTEWLAWYAVLQLVYRLTGFNISVALTDRFMDAVIKGGDFALRFDGRDYRYIDAGALWNQIMRSTWDWAEPGVLFMDTINHWNNLNYCETIIATNPCGEQPLPPYGACLLGSFNLVKYVTPNENNTMGFNYAQLRQDIPVVVRAMDNVINKSTYPLPQQEAEAKAKRRMGLGVTGMANAIEALGHPYGSEDFVKTEASILSEIANEAYEASAQLAQEKGSFPMYDPHSYLEAPFIKQLDPGVQASIRRFGVRNSHLTSIAPTGTISICADNVSSSIEPVFAYHQRRKIYMPSGLVETDFDDYGFRVFGVRGKRSLEVTMDEHLAVLACATKYVDSAVSKTCNVPIDTPWEAFKGLYMRAWRLNCKGLTTYQVGGKRAGIITSEDDPAKESTCRIDVKTGRHECD